MGLESGEFIPDLVDSNPAGTDPVSQGDDQLRLVKRCVQGSFGAFEGTEAAPKSVTLTEDQINDAALKSAIATITARWQHDANLAMANNTPLVGRNAADDGDRALAFLSPADVADFGSALTDARMVALLSFILRVDGADVGQFVQRSLGSLLVRDMNNVERKAGFRNPGNTSQGTNYTFLQSDEGQVVTKLGGATATYTCEPLEENTAITFINTSANQLTFQGGGGCSLEAMQGGAGLSGPFNLAADSVLQLYWLDSTQCIAYGNGIS